MICCDAIFEVEGDIESYMKAKIADENKAIKIGYGGSIKKLKMSDSTTGKLLTKAAEVGVVN